jgi:hypothetical protein
MQVGTGWKWLRSLSSSGCDFKVEQEGSTAELGYQLSYSLKLSPLTRNMPNFDTNIQEGLIRNTVCCLGCITC